ncbi:hypothetical protein Ct61P_11898 [Colletotrichum tofieldiae]|nr:hypothetical protein Ct61P_11898 [Colletotrichum tofieldiae]
MQFSYILIAGLATTVSNVFAAHVRIASNGESRGIGTWLTSSSVGLEVATALTAAGVARMDMRLAIAKRRTSGSVRVTLQTIAPTSKGPVEL